MSFQAEHADSQPLSYLREEANTRFAGYDHTPVPVVTADQLWDRMQTLIAAERAGMEGDENDFTDELYDFDRKDPDELDPVVFEESFPVSMEEADVVGDFDMWADATPEDIQYLLIGDTNHYNPVIKDWRYSGVHLEALRRNGFNDLVIEVPEYLQDIFDRYFDGEIKTRKSLEHQISKRIALRRLGVARLLDWMDKSAGRTPSNEARVRELMILNKAMYTAPIVNLCVKARSLNMRVHAFDEQVDPYEKEGQALELKTPRFYFNRMVHDEKIAHKIRDKFGNKRVAVIYGAAHFARALSLIERLGPEKCRTVNVHENLEGCKGFIKNSKYVAPFALILAAKKVIKTCGNYCREGNPNFDRGVSSGMMGLQKQEIDAFMERFNREFPDPYCDELMGVFPEEVFDPFEVYWHGRALKIGFYTEPLVEI